MHRFLILLISILSINQSINQSYATWVEPSPLMFNDRPSISHFVAARSSVTFPVTLIDYRSMSTLIWTNESTIEASINQLNNQTLMLPQLVTSQKQATIILPRTDQNDRIQPTLTSVCDSINQSINSTSPTCTVNITLYNRASTGQSISHSVTHIMNLKPDDLVTTTVSRGEWAYFSVYLTSDDTSLLISLSFDQSIDGQNADLYITNEDSDSPTDYLFPYRDASGSMYSHPSGQTMRLLLGPSPRTDFQEGIYIFSLFSPVDTVAAKSRFTLELTSGVGRTNSFTAGLFGIIGALIVAVLCFFAATALVIRNRRRAALTMSINHSLAQLQSGENTTVFIGSNGRMMMVTVHPVNTPVQTGVPPEQIAALPIFTYQNVADDEGRCTICLEDYVDQVSQLKRLPCGHDFDVTCIDTWLGSHKQCPLCQQDIETAHDVAKHDEHPIKPITIARTDQSTNQSINQSEEVELQTQSQAVHVTSQPEEFKESAT